MSTHTHDRSAQRLDTRSGRSRRTALAVAAALVAGTTLTGSPASAADYLEPGTQADVVEGSDGNDTVYLGNDGAVDRILCGAGRDEVYYAGAADPRDKLRSCERVFTG